MSCLPRRETKRGRVREIKADQLSMQNQRDITKERVETLADINTERQTGQGHGQLLPNR